MAADIDEMEAMISGTLAFVRDATRQAQRTRLELSSLVESVVDEMSETGLRRRRRAGRAGRASTATRSRCGDCSTTCSTTR